MTEVKHVLQSATRGHQTYSGLMFKASSLRVFESNALDCDVKDFNSVPLECVSRCLVLYTNLLPLVAVFISLIKSLTLCLTNW